MKTQSYLARELEVYRKDPTAITHRATLTLSNAIEERMEKLGISRGELANRAGLDPAQITRILSAEHNVTLRTLGKIFAALEIEDFEVAPIFCRRERIDMTPATGRFMPSLWDCSSKDEKTESTLDVTNEDNDNAIASAA